MKFTDAATMRLVSGSEWMETICELPNGSTLFREPNDVGGHRYWSDEIGGGVVVWDTSLVDRSTLLAALTEEERFIWEMGRKMRQY